MLVDLDNTLIDRDAAFRVAAAAFLGEYGTPDTDLAWLMALDASGYTPREAVASGLAHRYAHVPSAAVQTLLDRGGADHVILTRPVEQALAAAREQGWTCVIVTNGRTAQQEAKCRSALIRRGVTQRLGVLGCRGRRGV
jgi:putative hydrolase of the HAD superfamily